MARVLGVVLAILGIGYAWRGASVLWNLTDVTNAWIVASRDPDFRLDFDMFRMWGGLLALLLVVLGVSSLLFGSGAALRTKWARHGWMTITLIAVAAHLLLIPAHHFAGTFSRWTFAWFIVVCAMYGAVWFEQANERDLTA